MNKIAVGCALCALIVLSGCRSSETREARAERQQKEQAEMLAAIPADSPLSKIKLGMTEGEVGAILGAPTGQDNHITGKQFIPFNYAAKDTMRTTYYYKG